MTHECYEERIEAPPAELLAAILNKAARDYRPGAMAWAEKSQPALLEACNAAEKKLDEAYRSQVARRILPAGARYLAAWSSLGNAFADAEGEHAQQVA